jgi:GcrA cell cycle regulator
MVAWTEKRVARLKLFHKEGFSASVIAKKLGPAFTKGMVAGEINRLGLSAKPARSTRPTRKEPKASEKLAKSGKATRSGPAAHTRAASPIVLPQTKPHLIERPAQQLSSPKGVRLYDLRAGQCRWPLGDDRPAKFFCGAPTVPSKTWCEHHYRLAYGHAPPRQSRPHEGSPGHMLLRALRSRGRPRRVETAHAGP